jgi:hypothetical protein
VAASRTPSRVVQLFGELAPCLAAAHDKHPAGRQCVRIPIFLGQHLVDGSWNILCTGRRVCALIRARRHDDSLRIELSRRHRQDKALTTGSD